MGALKRIRARHSMAGPDFSCRPGQELVVGVDVDKRAAEQMVAGGLADEVERERDEHSEAPLIVETTMLDPAEVVTPVIRRPARRSR